MNLVILLDIVTSFIIAISLIILACVKIMPMRYLIWFGIGFAIACLWEITHALIPNFIFLKEKQSLAIKCLVPVAHSIWDSLILMIGGFIVLGLRMNLTSICALFVMIVFGLGQEVIVELIFNGRVWTYNNQLKANPVLFHIGKIEYTLWPWLEWILAPILFWVFIAFVLKK
jgi:hypothetical protein